MEIVVVIIMLLVSFSFLLKLTTLRRYGRIAVGAVAALFLLATYGAATGQSKTQIADWLTQPELMLDTSILLTVDVAFQLCFCVLAAKELTSPLRRAERWALATCRYVPGILIFPVLFAALTELVFSLPGTDFALLGNASAIVVLVLTPLLAAALKLLLPEEDIRIELIFMLNLIIAALGIVATVNGRTAATGTNAVDLTALLAVVALLLAGTVGGIFCHKILTVKKIAKL